MFEIFRKKRITKYTNNVSEYLKQTFNPEAPKVVSKKKSITTFLFDSETSQSIPDAKENVKFQKKKTESFDSGISYSFEDVRYSERCPADEEDIVGDKYDSLAVTKLMKNYSTLAASSILLNRLDKTINKTFVDILILHIDKKGMRDSEVYKAAQIDRRLFSKIMSDRQYKPSKDTVIAISIALKLRLDEANDLLSRAGFALSHSNKKDVIIEYFFREQIYNLDDINSVLFNLGQKIIGR